MAPPITTSTYTVEGRPDGGEENMSGQMYLTSSDYELMHESDGSEQVVLITFPNVDAPVTASVTNAYILFDVDEVRPGRSDAPVTVAIYGQPGAAAPPAATANDISTRPLTVQSITWTPPPSGTVHEDLMTPNIGSLVTEIMADSSWTLGSRMGFIFSKINGDGTRWVESARVNNGIQTPALVVDYMP